MWSYHLVDTSPAWASPRVQVVPMPGRADFPSQIGPITSWNLKLFFFRKTMKTGRCFLFLVFNITNHANRPWGNSKMKLYESPMIDIFAVYYLVKIPWIQWQNSAFWGGPEIPPGIPVPATCSGVRLGVLSKTGTRTSKLPSRSSMIRWFDSMYSWKFWGFFLNGGLIFVEY